LTTAPIRTAGGTRRVIGRRPNRWSGKMP